MCLGVYLHRFILQCRWLSLAPGARPATIGRMTDKYKAAAEAREAALCEPCRGIQRNWRRAPGHAELVQTQNWKEERGGKPVTITRWRCDRCASTWDYENDKNNQQAGWSLPSR